MKDVHSALGELPPPSHHQVIWQLDRLLTREHVPLVARSAQEATFAPAAALPRHGAPATPVGTHAAATGAVMGMVEHQRDIGPATASAGPFLTLVQVLDEGSPDAQVALV